MFKLSKKADYAIVALSHLLSINKPISAREIANSYNLSAQMLANVLKVLTTAGILISKRGVAGGYQLAKEPEYIFLGEIIDVIDGPQRFSDCSNLDKECKAEDCCPARLPMLMIHKKLKGFLDSLSLIDVIKETELGVSAFEPKLI